MGSDEEANYKYLSECFVSKLTYEPQVQSLPVSSSRGADRQFECLVDRAHIRNSSSPNPIRDVITTLEPVGTSESKKAHTKVGEMVSRLSIANKNSKVRHVVFYFLYKGIDRSRLAGQET